jgi:hypothetical protein
VESSCLVETWPSGHKAGAAQKISDNIAGVDPDFESLVATRRKQLLDDAARQAEENDRRQADNDRAALGVERAAQQLLTRAAELGVSGEDWRSKWPGEKGWMITSRGWRLAIGLRLPVD